MTDELRFDGQVAIVTGGGGRWPSLGPAYVKLLAARGAKVVVNRLGVGWDGRGTAPANPHAVAEEIVAAGGEAIGDLHSVADPAAARATVQAALDAWGRVDILVNNAGVVMRAFFDEISDDDIRRIVDTHLYGHIWMTRAVWPHMRAAGYGRIVNTTSDAIFAYPQVAVYGAAKAGVNGLTTNLAFEGGRYGIRVNAVSPSAATVKHPEMAGVEDTESYLKGKEHQVEQVASLVAYLSHSRCKPNGAVFYAGKGTVREYRIYTSRGWHDPDITIDSVAANIDRIQDHTGAIEHSTGLTPDDIDTTPRRTYTP